MVPAATASSLAELLLVAFYCLLAGRSGIGSVDSHDEVDAVVAPIDGEPVVAGTPSGFFAATFVNGQSLRQKP